MKKPLTGRDKFHALSSIETLRGLGLLSVIEERALIYRAIPGSWEAENAPPGSACEQPWPCAEEGGHDG